MVVSPLWFVAVYLLFVCLMPITVWLHRRYDLLVLVVLAGLAVIVDILRFRYDMPGIEWVNMIFVWGFASSSASSTAGSPAPAVRPRYADGRIDWAYQAPGHRQQARMLTARPGFSAWSGLSFPGSTRGRWWASPARTRTWPRRRCASSR